MSESTPWPLVDLALSRRLEGAEADANANFVRARAQLQPEVGADVLERAGVAALFDGVDSPCTQSFGLGLSPEAASDALLDALEDFFASHGASSMHEVSPLMEAELLPRLVSRGYRPIELSSVLHLSLTHAPKQAPREDVEIERIDGKDASRWAKLAAGGWGDTPELAEFVRGIGEVGARARGRESFIAHLEGEPAGTGAMAIHEGVALLAGASTLPAARRRGVQAALLEHRLAWARAQGCELAMMCATPGSDSQRNAERSGFRVAYTRIKWAKGLTA